MSKQLEDINVMGKVIEETVKSRGMGTRAMMIALAAALTSTVGLVAGRPRAVEFRGKLGDLLLAYCQQDEKEIDPQ